MTKTLDELRRRMADSIDGIKQAASARPHSSNAEAAAYDIFLALCSPDNIRLLLDTLTALEAENARLQEALVEIATQRLPGEMDSDEVDDADFEGGYQSCVIRARITLGETP